MQIKINTVAKTIEILSDTKLSELNDFMSKHDDSQEYSIVPGGGCSRTPEGYEAKVGDWMKKGLNTEKQPKTITGNPV